MSDSKTPLTAQSQEVTHLYLSLASPRGHMISQEVASKSQETPSAYPGKKYTQVVTETYQKAK